MHAGTCVYRHVFQTHCETCLVEGILWDLFWPVSHNSWVLCRWVFTASLWNATPCIPLWLRSSLNHRLWDPPLLSGEGVLCCWQVKQKRGMPGWRVPGANRPEASGLGQGRASGGGGPPESSSRAGRQSPSLVGRIQATTCPGTWALAIRITQVAASNSLFKIKSLCFGAGHWPTPYSLLKPEVLSSMWHHQAS